MTFSQSRIHLVSLTRSQVRVTCHVLLAIGLLSACATVEEQPPSPVVAPAPLPPPAAPPLPPPPAPPQIATTPQPLPLEMPVPPKETTPEVELPSYARKGRRLPADGGEAGRTFLSYCRSHEVDRDAASYYRRLERNKQLPSAETVAARSREAGQPLSTRQIVERDWAIQRENAKSTPQRCRVLGGSVDVGVAILVVEADIYGKRQRGTATVVPTNGKWRVRDHGSWEAIKPQ